MDTLDITHRDQTAQPKPTVTGENKRLLLGLGATVLAYWLLSWVLGLFNGPATPLIEVVVLGVAGIALVNHLHRSAGRAWPPADRLVAISFIVALVIASTGWFSAGGHSLVHLVLIVPLAEEIFFRGAVQGVALRTWGYIPAIVLTTGLFVLLHAPAGLEAMAQLTVLSLACCGLRMLRHGLLAAVIVHAAWNLAAVTGTSDPYTLANPWVVITSGIVLAAVLTTLARLPLPAPEEVRA